MHQRITYSSRYYKPLQYLIGLIDPVKLFTPVYNPDKETYSLPYLYNDYVNTIEPVIITDKLGVSIKKFLDDNLYNNKEKKLLLNELLPLLKIYGEGVVNILENRIESYILYKINNSDYISECNKTIDCINKIKISLYNNILNYYLTLSSTKKEQKVNVKISDVFLTHASNVLADTQDGLTGTEIGKYFSAKSIEFNIDIPHHKPPFENVQNKRTAFLENLQVFNDTQQFDIIVDLCEKSRISDLEEVKNLKNKLMSSYPQYIKEETKNINEELISKTEHWLEKYKKSHVLYVSAIEKFTQNLYQRNLIDDLRLSLELFLKEILKNDKSLEKQISDIGIYQKEMEISTEVRNMFNALLDYYSKYQNKYIKHDDNVNLKEIEFIIDLTSSFIKFLIKEE